MKLSEYLIEEWSLQSNLKFLERLDAKLEIIKSNPKVFPESEYEQGLRRCVITKQTSILYEIKDDVISVLTVIDNRQDQGSIFEEIKKHFAQ